MQCVPEGGDGSVGLHEPVATAVGCGGDRRDGLGACSFGERAVEMCVAEREHPAIGSE